MDIQVFRRYEPESYICQRTVVFVLSLLVVVCAHSIILLDGFTIQLHPELIVTVCISPLVMASQKSLSTTSWLPTMCHSVAGIV